jgi:hypothetical protein
MRNFIKFEKKLPLIIEHFNNIFKVCNGKFNNQCGSYLFNGNEYKYDLKIKAKQKLLFNTALKSKNVLEIGVYMGHSILLMLAANPKLKICCIDINDEFSRPAIKYLKKKFPTAKIQFIKGNSLDVLPTLKKRFDLFHIDGNHKNSIATKEFLHCINLRKNNNFKVIFDDVRTCEPLKNNIVKNFTIKILKEAACGSKNCFINIEIKNDTIKNQIKKFKLDYIKFFILTLPLRFVKIIPVKLIPFKFILPRKIINFVKYL